MVLSSFSKGIAFKVRVYNRSKKLRTDCRRKGGQKKGSTINRSEWGIHT